MRHFKRSIALFLVTLFLLSVIPVAFANAYNVGDVIEYGSYPQTQITDTVRIEQFRQDEANDAAAGNPWNWTSYNYTSGSGQRYDGQMKTGSFMSYHDFTHGSETYRAVKITSLRPYYAGYEADNDPIRSYQDDNGFTAGNIYYFHFEPLKWRVLEPSSGLLISQSIIDAQPFQSVVYSDGEQYYTSTAKKNLANDYQNSSLNDWLKRSFFVTAFDRGQQRNIPTALITFADGSTTSERVFAPSLSDVTNRNYGFGEIGIADTARKVSGTDYAKCQGLFKTTDNRNSGLAPWWLRDHSADSGKALCVTYEGKVQNESSTVDLNYVGVRVMCYFNGLVSEDELCPLCGEKHGTSFIQRIIAFFHKIFAFIRRTDKNMG